MPVSSTVAGVLLYLPSFRQGCCARLALLQRQASPWVRGAAETRGDFCIPARRQPFLGTPRQPPLIQGSPGLCRQVTSDTNVHLHLSEQGASALWNPW